MTQSERKRPQSVDPRRLKLTNDAGTQGVLLGRRCRQCGVYGFGPAAFCQACTAGDLEPVELSGRGTLYSYTTVRVAPAGWPGEVPYVLAQVELPEGPHVLAEMIDCEDADLQIGAPVELALLSVKAEGAEGAKVVYKFRPQRPAAGATKEKP